MPGLLFQGPRRIETPTLSDLLHARSIDKLGGGGGGGDSSAPCVLDPPLSPLTPGGKHKACRPSLSHSSWIPSFKELESGGGERQSAADRHGQCGGGGGDGDGDLAAMVHEFIEDGCRDDHDGGDAGDSAAHSGSLCDSLKVLGWSKSMVEEELLGKVSAVLLGMSEETMACDRGGAATDCNCSCVRQLVVKHLKSQGYDAAICKLRWPISGNVPGGDYEYVDVVFEGQHQAEEQRRVILDLDFQSQFEIARPTPSYKSALKLLPAVFVGSVTKLHRVLEIMSEAAKQSLSQNSMHLPPWRTVEYMLAKWLSSPHERVRSGGSKVVPVAVPDEEDPSAASPPPGSRVLAPRQAWRRFSCTEVCGGGSGGGSGGRGGCYDQLKRIKESLRAAAAAAAAMETDHGALPVSRISRSSSQLGGGARDRERCCVHGYRRSSSSVYRKR